MRHLLAQAVYTAALAYLVAGPASAGSLDCITLNAPPTLDGGILDSGALMDAGAGAPPLPAAAVFDYDAETPCLGQSDGFAVASWASTGSTTTALAQATGANQPVCRGSDGSWAVDADGSNDYMSHAGATNYTAYTICMVGGFDAAGSARNSKYVSDGDLSTERGAYVATNASRQWTMFGGSTIIPVTAFEASDNSYDIYCMSRDAAGNGNLIVNGSTASGAIGTHNFDGITMFSYWQKTALYPSFRLKRWIMWNDDSVRQTAYDALVGIYGSPPIAF